MAKKKEKLIEVNLDGSNLAVVEEGVEEVSFNGEKKKVMMYLVGDSCREIGAKISVAVKDSKGNINTIVLK